MRIAARTARAVLPAQGEPDVVPVNQQRLNANIGGIKKVRNEYRVYLTDARGKVVFECGSLRELRAPYCPRRVSQTSFQRE
jgi:hypothetical protein